MSQDDSQPDPATQGDGEPGSSAGGDRGPVPYSRFSEVVAEKNAAKEQAARLEGQVEALMASQGTTGPGLVQQVAPASEPDKSPERVVTKSDLDRLVLEGSISQGEADQLWEQQIQTKATNAAVDKIATQTRSKELADKANEAAARYKAVRPSIWEPGSTDRQKLQTEFDRLVAEGADGNNPMTQVHAMQAAFGKVEFLEAAKKGRPGHETHVETGHGGAAPVIGSDQNQDGSPKGLTTKERSYYKGQIDKGLYKGWGDPDLVKELTNYRNPDRAKRLSAQ
jgi:hypothetical protein